MPATFEDIFSELSSRVEALICVTWEGIGSEPKVLWKPEGHLFCTIGITVLLSQDLLLASISYMEGLPETEVSGIKEFLTPDNLEFATEIELRELATKVSKHCVWAAADTEKGFVSFGGDPITAHFLLALARIELLHSANQSHLLDDLDDRNYTSKSGQIGLVEARKYKLL
jgi:hypothetical protein